MHRTHVQDASAPAGGVHPPQRGPGAQEGTIEVDADQTALQALAAHGHRVMSSCEAGSCGTCRTTYLSGDVEHRDIVLGDDEKDDQIMVCVSRAKGDCLTLDL
jgi:phthalate 4,5-dioxygenase reductase subunit